MKHLIIFCLLSLSPGLLVQEAQWRGPWRNGIYPDSMLLKTWPEEGPERILKVEGRRSYSSPVLYAYQDIRLILGFTSKDLIAVDPEDGHIVWTYPYYLHSVEENVGELGINMTNVPLFKENEIFITSGYNCPSVMLSLADDGKSVSEIWINPTLDNHHHGVVLVDGYIYGSNFYSNSFGKWVCLDWETGEVMYLTDWENKGSIIYADGMFIVYEEKKGNIALVDQDPGEFRVLSSFRNREGKGPHWAHPSIYGGRLMIRHGDVLQVFDIRDKTK